LLSRCQVYVLKALQQEDLIRLLHQAIEKDPWLSEQNITLRKTEALIRISGGDARKLLNLFELVIDSMPANAPEKSSRMHW